MEVSRQHPEQIAENNPSPHVTQKPINEKKKPKNTIQDLSPNSYHVLKGFQEGILIWTNKTCDYDNT